LSRAPGGLEGLQVRRVPRRGLVCLRKHSSLARRRSSKSLGAAPQVSNFYAQGSLYLRLRLTLLLGGFDNFFVSEAWARTLSSTLALYPIVESGESRGGSQDFLWARKFTPPGGGPSSGLPCHPVSISLAQPLLQGVVKVLGFFNKVITQVSKQARSCQAK
jgi:hypothetical protein